MAVRVAGAEESIERAMEKTVVIRSWEKNTGKERWQSTIEGRILKDQEACFVYFIEKGEEKGDAPEKSKTWFSSAYSIITDSTIVPYSVSVVVKNASGEAIEKIEKFYDLKDKVVICRTNGAYKQLKFTPNMLDKQNIAIGLMYFPFETSREETYHLYTHEPSIYELFVKNRGKERVEVGGRTVDCYKLEMVFNLGLLNVINVFIPKFYLWYDVAPPHFFVRYEGLESGIGTPYVVIEALQ